MNNFKKILASTLIMSTLLPVGTAFASTTVYTSDDLSCKKYSILQDKSYINYEKIKDKDLLLTLVKQFTPKKLGDWNYALSERKAIKKEIKNAESTYYVKSSNLDFKKDILQKYKNKNKKNNQSLKSALLDGSKHEIKSTLNKMLKNLQTRNDNLRDYLDEIK